MYKLKNNTHYLQSKMTFLIKIIHGQYFIIKMDWKKLKTRV